MRFIKAFTWLSILTIAFVVSILPAFSQGVIVPGPCERCPGPQSQLPRSLPVKSIKIDARIVTQVATTHVEQIFHNPTNSVLEGTYFFPIPEGASISEFALWDGDRRLVGEVRTREEARRIYDEIVRRQRDPGLLEYAGKDLFQASIFPIPARSDKKLEITYTQILKAESGTVGYKYPLGTGRNLVRIGTVSGTVQVDGSQPVRNIYSPSHDIDIKKQGENRANITFQSRNDAVPKDLELYYSLSREDFGVSLLTHREPGKDGYFLLTISPKDNFDDREYSSKDIVFVIDTSGSMADEGKMEKARSALLFGVRGLRSEDRFNIISFAGEDHVMANRLISADETGRARGVTYIKQLRPTGGTNINEAMLAAERQFENGDRPRMIVFITDGLPTVGETNIERILHNVSASRVPGVRVFSFGVGYDVNTALLDRLSSGNGGVAQYVEPKEDLEQKVSAFFEKVSFPVITGIHLDMGGVETDLVYPRELQDIFKGSQLTILGRYRNQVDVVPVRMKLNGRDGSNDRAFFYDNLRFPLNEDNNDFLPRLWANRRVGWLMEQIRTNGEQKELRDEVVDLGTRFGIVTPYTSYLAVEPGMQPSREAVQGMDEVTVVPSMPMSRPSASRGGIGGRAKDARLSTNATSGAEAVISSKTERALQDSVRDIEDDKRTAGVKRAGSKTFYLTDGAWIDSDFKSDAKLPETVLTFASEAYFDILKMKPKLAEFFSLAERVVVVFEGRVYRISAASN
jgi:Ca-activated chloride channel family protein